MLRVLRMMAFSQAAIKVNSGSGDPKVSKGRSQTSSVLTALWSPPQRRNPCLRERPAMVVSQAIWSRPFGATLHRCWVEQLGGAPEGAQSYWQGRFAACAFVERVGHTGRPRNSWGVAPNPTRDRRKGTKSPLDPFWAPRLERVSAALWDSGVKPGSPRPSPIPQSPHPRYTDSTAVPSAGQYPAAYSEYPPPAHSHWQSPAA